MARPENRMRPGAAQPLLCRPAWVPHSTPKVHVLKMLIRAGIKKTISVVFKDEWSSGVRRRSTRRCGEATILIDVHPAGPGNVTASASEARAGWESLLKAHISLAAPRPLGCVVHWRNGGVNPLPTAPVRQDW